MPTVMGVDEAGRGPVIGPLVICGVLMDEQDVELLVKEKVKDSKLLTPKQREAIFSRLKKIMKKHKLIHISPEEIDEAVDGKDGLNLNWLEAEKTVQLINELEPDIAIIDCPSNNVKAYTDYLRERIRNKKVKLIVEHKADVHYPVASAASICAKVTRDEEVSKLEKKYGKVGSGYPADPITQKFLKENWSKHPEIFRHSWKSYKNMHMIKDQKKLGEY